MTTSLAALCGLEFSKTRCRRCCGVEVQRSSGPGRFSRVVPSGPRARPPTRPISAEMSSPYFWGHVSYRMSLAVSRAALNTGTLSACAERKRGGRKQQTFSIGGFGMYALTTRTSQAGAVRFGIQDGVNCMCQENRHHSRYDIRMRECCVLVICMPIFPINGPNPHHENIFFFFFFCCSVAAIWACPPYRIRTEHETGLRV